MRLKGIDISEHQGTVNWALVTEAEFVMIRAGYGQGTTDREFRRNAEGCTMRGIPFGVYWFSYARTADMARREAEYCLELIRPYRLRLPVAFDWEYDSRAHARSNGVEPTRELVTAMCHSFCKTVRAAGHTPMNYTNVDYLQQFFDESTFEYPLWLAQWGEERTWAHPKADIWLWQYGLTRTAGFPSPVDGNIAYRDFNKEDPVTYEEFKEYMERYETELAELPPGDWSEAERAWAEQTGLIRGDEQGRRRWRSHMTREEYAVTQYRQAESRDSL